MCTFSSNYNFTQLVLLPVSLLLVIRWDNNPLMEIQRSHALPQMNTSVAHKKLHCTRRAKQFPVKSLYFIESQRFIRREVCTDVPGWVLIQSVLTLGSITAGQMAPAECRGHMLGVIFDKRRWEGVLLPKPGKARWTKSRYRGEEGVSQRVSCDSFRVRVNPRRGLRLTTFKFSRKWEEQQHIRQLMTRWRQRHTSSEEAGGLEGVM